MLADFMAALDPVNAAADAAPGFAWRLRTEDGNATSVRAFEWDQAGSAGVIVNMSVWESVEALAGFVYRPARGRAAAAPGMVERIPESYSALWWVPAGALPTTQDAEQAVRLVRANGPPPAAFTLKEHFPPPGVPGRRPELAPRDWMCAA